MRDFMSSLLFARYDGRPNYKERKLCNFVTGTINCSHMLLGDCYTESDIARIGFYDLHDETFARDYPGWDTEKCPAVKYDNSLLITFPDSPYSGSTWHAGRKLCRETTWCSPANKRNILSSSLLLWMLCHYLWIS